MVRPSRIALDQLDDAIHVAMRHAGGGLVQQHHLGFERQGGGDLQRALQAVGQVGHDGFGERGQPDIEQQLVGAVVVDLEHALRAPEIEAGAAGPLQGQAHVLQRRQMREDGRDLEAADQPQPGHHGRLHARDVATLKRDLAARGRQEGGQQVEACRLAGAVGTDQGVDVARLHAQIDGIDSHEAAELSRQAFGLQDGVCHPRTSPHFAIGSSERGVLHMPCRSARPRQPEDA